ncbi:uncharacterized protein AAES06_017519 [Glossophaga mutica]
MAEQALKRAQRTQPPCWDGARREAPAGAGPVFGGGVCDGWRPDSPPRVPLRCAPESRERSSKFPFLSEMASFVLSDKSKHHCLSGCRAHQASPGPEGCYADSRFRLPSFPV